MEKRPGKLRGRFSIFIPVSLSVLALRYKWLPPVDITVIRTDG